MKIPTYIKEVIEVNPNIGREGLAEKAGISISDARFYCKLYKENREKPVLKGVAIGDIHYPDVDIATNEIFFEFLKDFNPDIFILAGDCMDMGSISFYNKNKPKLTEGKRLKREYKSFQLGYLDIYDNILKDACKRYFFIGNHEYRVDRLIEENPQFEGWIEVENNLDLSEYKVIPFNEVMNLGDMYFIHGAYWNKYHAEKNARVYGKHVFSWHVHTNQVFSMFSPINRLPRQGVSVGCACNKNPDYMRNKPNNWVNQFLFFYLYGDGSFTYYTPIIINGKSIINGKKYKV